LRFTVEEDRKKRKSSPLPGEDLFALFKRLLGLVALGFAILAMARLIGVPGLSPSRFDLMPVEWRTAATTLTVLYAAAGFGLWQLTRWGLVIWAAACLIQILMHTVFAEYFGVNRELIAVITILLIAYSVFWLYVYFGKRKRALAKH
jgi:hypothetical protein